jgi:pyruvate,water dikinase
MRFAPLPDEVRAELASRYEDLVRESGAEPPVAVRSSALGEDGEDATFAGQQESFLWVRGFEHVCDAVRDCWASLYTPRAISYRTARGAGGEEPAMGVTVQAMVDAEVSGVLFTCNPVSGDPSMVAIEASWGLGIAVVGGETTPDDFLVSKVTGEVVRRTVNSKEIEYVPDAAGRGTVRVEVPENRRNAACLHDEHLAALVDLARRVERHYGSHQDVEWALARGRSLPDALVVLQARPVTAVPERAPKLSGSALSLVLSTFGAPSPKNERG